MQIGLPGNHPMWTLQARYSPIQLGQTSTACACRSKWWLAVAAVAGGGLAYALTGKKKRKGARP